MFGFLGVITRPGPRPQAAGDNAVLSFGPARIVAAIEFHLLDGKAARAVSGESRRATIDRLSRDVAAPTIRRTRWGAMTDADRLRWLLEQSCTAIRFDREGVAELVVKS